MLRVLSASVSGPMAGLMTQSSVAMLKTLLSNSRSFWVPATTSSPSSSREIVDHGGAAPDGGDVAAGDDRGAGGGGTEQHRRDGADDASETLHAMFPLCSNLL